MLPQILVVTDNIIIKVTRGNTMSDANQVTIKDLKITGPLAGKKLEIQFDLKPIEEKKEKDKDKDKDKNQNQNQKKNPEKKSSDGVGLGVLFFLLFALIFMLGQTGGFSSLNYSEAETQRNIQYRYLPALR